jgi:hypothetical protein
MDKVEYDKQYKESNRELLRLKAKAYREKNKDKIKAYRDKNKDKYKAKYQENRIQILANAQMKRDDERIKRIGRCVNDCLFSQLHIKGYTYWDCVYMLETVKRDDGKWITAVFYFTDWHTLSITSDKNQAIINHLEWKKILKDDPEYVKKYAT